jgi:hypothetical protein
MPMALVCHGDSSQISKIVWKELKNTAATSSGKIEKPAP